MARFGRSQPHAPIFLRAPLVAAALSAALAPAIHVVQAEPHRPPATRVVFLRAPLAPLPTKQIHVVGAPLRTPQHPARDADVLFLRAPITLAAPDRLAPQVHVISPVDARTPAVGRRTRAIIQRTALTPPLLSTQQASQIHVLQPNVRARANPPTHVVFVRTPLVPPALASGNGPQIHVISPNWRVVHPARDADVTILRAPVTALVPDRLPRQITLVLQHRRRPDPPAHVVRTRNPAVIVAARLAPQVHVYLQHRRRPDPATHFVFERNPLVAPLAPLVRAIARALGTASVQPRQTATITVTPTLVGSVAFDFLDGVSVMDTYTTATTDFDTSSTHINTSSAPMGGR